MNVKLRFIVVAFLLFFAWKGSVLDFEWPITTKANRSIPKPGPEALRFAAPLQGVLPRMTHIDRIYLSNFYDALAYIVFRDSQRDKPLITDTEKFAAFHAGSLQLAIDRKDVGKYDGLGDAIDQVFAAAVGPEIKQMTPEVRDKIVGACGVLAWTLGINGDG
jgi:hypothetical protein